MATSWCKASVEEDRRSIFIYKPGSFVALAPIQGAGEEHSDEQGQVAWAADYKVWGEAAMRSVLRAGTYDRPVSSRAWGSKPAASPPPPPHRTALPISGAGSDWIKRWNSPVLEFEQYNRMD
ncbi:RHS domain-containing protein [Delftia tsuruhatensis]|nr:RHS domain-containing protein [Delftia tsuruhatensis]MCO5337166.1 RHS domain-containing protein [Delftia tsuruhatensis]MCR4548245.1 RHS domain-containing protein [Delftia tsuruhatensis]